MYELLVMVVKDKAAKLLQSVDISIHNYQSLKYLFIENLSGEAD